MEEERRITTGQALVAVLLVVLGIVVGRFTVGEPDVGAGGTAAPDAGPSDMVDGVPVGYERSREGAVAAALNYGTVLSDPAFVTDAGRRGKILSAITTEEVAKSYEDEGAAALADLAETPLYRGIGQGVPTVWTGAPLGYRVGRYSDDGAEIFTWSVGVLGNREMKPRAIYSSSVTRLTWDGDWKIAGSTGEDGPVPALAEDASTSSGSDFASQLRGLKGVHHVP